METVEPRGYQVERRVDTVDTNGVPVRVSTGVVRDQHGDFYVGLGIGDKPTALLTADLVIELIACVSLSAKDVRHAEVDLG